MAEERLGGKSAKSMDLDAADAYNGHLENALKMNPPQAESRGSKTLQSEDFVTDKEERQAILWQLLNAQVNAAPSGVAVLRGREAIQVNPKLAFLLGRSIEELEGKNTLDWYEGMEEFDRVGLMAHELLSKNPSARFDARMRRADGTTFWGRLAGAKAGPELPGHSIWHVSDVSEEKEALARLNLADAAIEATSDAVMITDERNRIIRVNPAFERVTGWSFDDVAGRDPKILGSGRHGPEFFGPMWAALQGRGHWEGEIWDRRKNGEEYPKWLKIDAIRDEFGDIRNFVAVFSDITEKKERDERLAFLANHDSLTKLPNRTALDLHLGGAFARCKRHRTRLALMYLDLDGFKAVNDTWGHEAGDKLLCEVAGRISASVRESDFVARLGGDEFVICLEEGEFPGDALAVSRKVIQNVSLPVDLGVGMAVVGVSVGIGLWPDDGVDIQQLKLAADKALYVSKNSGKGKASFASSAMSVPAGRSDRSREMLSSAVISKALRLEMAQSQFQQEGFQPVLTAKALWPEDCSSTLSCKEASIEAGMESELEMETLRLACEWIQSNPESDLPVSIEIGARTWKWEGFASKAASIRSKYGVQAGRLEISVPEKALGFSVERSWSVANGLKMAGFKIRASSFCAGGLGLAELSLLEIDGVEFDASWSGGVLEEHALRAARAAKLAAAAMGLDIRAKAFGEEQARELLAEGFACVRIENNLAVPR